MNNADVQKTGILKLILAWGLIGIPLLAGVAQTLANALKPFQ